MQSQVASQQSSVVSLGMWLSSQTSGIYILALELLKLGLADAFLQASVSSSVTREWQSLIRWYENAIAYSI